RTDPSRIGVRGRLRSIAPTFTCPQNRHNTGFQFVASPMYNRCDRLNLNNYMDVAALRSVPLFASLDSKMTAQLGQYLTIHDYPNSAAICRIGDPGDALYLIDMGKVRISITDADGHVVTLAELGPGEFFGEMSLLDGRGRSANATVIQNARLAKLTRDDLLSFMRSDPRIALE